MLTLFYSKLADWDDDDPQAQIATSSRWDKVVVLKHMFTLQELDVGLSILFTRSCLCLKLLYHVPFPSLPLLITLPSSLQRLIGPKISRRIQRPFLTLKKTSAPNARSWVSSRMWYFSTKKPMAWQPSASRTRRPRWLA